MRHAIEKSCNVYFYTLGNMLGSIASTSGRRSSGSASGAGSTCPDEIKGLVPSTAWKKTTRASQVVPGRDDLGLDRSGTGQRHADFPRGDDDDGRERRHAVHAARHQGRRRRQGLAAGASAAAAVDREDEAIDDRCAARRAVDGRERRRNRRARQDPGLQRRRQDRNGADDLARGRQGCQGQDRRPRSRLVRLLRAARQAGDRRRDLRRALRARLPRRADRQVRDGDVFRQEGRTAAAGPAAESGAGAGAGHRGCQPGARDGGPASDSVRSKCSNADCSSTSTGCCSPPSSSSPASVWR